MIELAYKLLTKLGITKHQDKVLHFLGGLIISVILTPLISIWSFMIVVIVAVGKEFLDRKPTGFDYYDIAATLFGGWLGMVIYGLLI